MKSERVCGERLASGHSGRIFFLITFGFFALKLGQRLLPPLLPAIIDDLSITPFEAGVALSLMALMRAVLQFPGGRYSDGLSRITLLLAGIGSGLAGFLLLIVTSTYGAFVFGVVVIGIGQGLYDPAARALLSDMFIDKRGRAFGLHFFASDSAGVFAAIMATILVLTWRTAFIPSILLLLPISFLLSRWSCESVVFKRVDLKVRDTALRLTASRRLRWALLAYSLIVFASVGMTSFLAEFLVTMHGFSIKAAGFSFILLYAVGALVKPLAGWLSDSLPRLTIVGGGVLLGGASLAVMITASTPIIVFSAIIGYAIGQRAFPPPFQAYLMDRFPGESMGGDLGAVRTTYLTIGSLGPAFVGFIASHVSYVTAYSTLVICFVGAAAITFSLAYY